MDIDVSGLAAMDNGLHWLAVFTSRVHDGWWADGVKIPNVMGDVLEMANIFAGFQVNRDERVGVKIVAGT